MAKKKQPHAPPHAHTTFCHKHTNNKNGGRVKPPCDASAIPAPLPRRGKRDHPIHPRECEVEVLASRAMRLDGDARYLYPPRGETREGFAGKGRGGEENPRGQGTRRETYKKKKKKKKKKATQKGREKKSMCICKTEGGAGPKTSRAFHVPQPPDRLNTASQRRDFARYHQSSPPFLS